MTGGPTAWSPTARHSTPSCATTTSRDSPRGASSPRSCSRPRPSLIIPNSSERPLHAEAALAHRQAAQVPYAAQAQEDDCHAGRVLAALRAAGAGSRPRMFLHGGLAALGVPL